LATIAITGAGRGIGLELTRQYVAAGDHVIALCRDPDAATALGELAAGSDGRISIHRMDVGDDASVKAAIAEIGDQAVDILFNVAGISGPYEAELELGSSDWAVWQDALNILTMAPLRVLQGFLPRMQAGSKVMNVTSQLAASTWPYGGFYVYGAAKAGLNRLMRSVAIDLKDRGIIVGIIHPGYVRTDMGGPDADISPEESAAGLKKVAAEWQLETSGDFLKWNGEPHPW
jgi:NAD(P)-dependent dehydrogenase (short-subunit alcohol dehydrogenase family)